jgi:hypothetical protein
MVAGHRRRGSSKLEFLSGRRSSQTRSNNNLRSFLVCLRAQPPTKGGASSDWSTRAFRQLALTSDHCNGSLHFYQA